METTQDRTKPIKFQSRRADDLPLCAHVKIAVEHYFSQLNGHDSTGLYSMVISEVEKPLIQSALKHTGFNQCKTAKILGISRSTLRNKIALYDIT